MLLVCPLGLPRLRLAFVTFTVLALATPLAYAFTWQGVRQLITIMPDGSVVVRDDRSAVAGAPFDRVGLFVPLKPGTRLALLPGTGANLDGFRVEVRALPVEGGVRLEATSGWPVRQLPLRFRYRLTGALDYYRDVVNFDRVLVTSRETPVRDYRVWLRAPGGMMAPYGAFIHRQDFGILPESSMSADRSSFRAEFDLVPAGAEVGARYLLDPALFDTKGTQPGLARLRRAEFFQSGIAALRRSSLWALAVLLLNVLLGVRVFIALTRFRRWPELTERTEYQPPNYLPPAAVALLSGCSPAAGMRATLLDLARRGLVQLRPEASGVRVQLQGAGELLPFEHRLAERPEPAEHSSWQADVQAWLEDEMGMSLVDPESVGAARRYGRLAVALLVVSLIGTVLTVASPRFLFALCSLFALGLAVLARTSLSTRRTDVKLQEALWRRFGALLQDEAALRAAPDAFLQGWPELYAYAVALGVDESFLGNLQEVAAGRGLYLPPPGWRGPAMAASDPFESLRQVSQSLRAAFPEVRPS
ncbi:MAG TPA: hypothetical protein VF171_07550 [Trueperaceae bacterium]